MKTRLTILLCWFSVYQLSNSVLAQNKTNGKKLIEFGWDYPNVALLKNNIMEMEKAPDCRAEGSALECLLTQESGRDFSKWSQRGRTPKCPPLD